MITEDYVSFETAKLLKEKGFEVPSLKPEEWAFCMYDEEGKLRWGCYSDDWYCRITLQMAMKWLREKEIFVEVTHTLFSSPHKYHYSIFRTEPEFYTTGDEYKSYEEACKAGIKYCLENLI